MYVASEFPLPELLPWTGPADAEPDLRFRYGAVPDHLENADYVAPLFQTKGKDLYLLAIQGSARFLVRNGRDVCVQLAASDDEGLDPLPLLSGTVQGVIYHQRGLFPLHASTVVSGGQAIAIAAPSGTGKSTMAAALAARGFSVVGDDICVIQTASSAAPQVLPTYPRLRLWRDTVEALAFDADALKRAVKGKEKYLVDQFAEFSPEPTPLNHVVLLVREPSRREQHLERLKGSSAVKAIVSNVHVRRAAGALGLHPRLFVSASRVAAHSCVWRLTVPDRIDRLGDAADAICSLPAAKQ